MSSFSAFRCHDSQKHHRLVHQHILCGIGRRSRRTRTSWTQAILRLLVLRLPPRHLLSPCSLELIPEAPAVRGPLTVSQGREMRCLQMTIGVKPTMDPPPIPVSPRPMISLVD